MVFKLCQPTRRFFQIDPQKRLPRYRTRSAALEGMTDLIENEFSLSSSADKTLHLERLNYEFSCFQGISKAFAVSVGLTATALTVSSALAKPGIWLE